jgi:hypothetical protein
MTIYIDLEEKLTTKTVFTHYLDTDIGWVNTKSNPKLYYKVVYLGKCPVDGDMFACYNDDNEISILKGIKGDEF